MTVPTGANDQTAYFWRDASSGHGTRESFSRGDLYCIGNRLAVRGKSENPKFTLAEGITSLTSQKPGLFTGSTGRVSVRAVAFSHLRLQCWAVRVVASWGQQCRLFVDRAHVANLKRRRGIIFRSPLDIPQAGQGPSAAVEPSLRRQTPNVKRSRIRARNWRFKPRVLSDKIPRTKPQSGGNTWFDPRRNSAAESVSRRAFARNETGAIDCIFGGQLTISVGARTAHPATTFAELNDRWA